MDKLNITQLYNVDNPEEVARTIGTLQPEVLLIDYYNIPWTVRTADMALFMENKFRGSG